ncbi:hypothetical protein RHMOL_Rhmol01G0109900 [Rhododendron molle]|uniref:Uncharacterized protein n=1 Tax=Rhododendron molle TaxID=49168 RepID=A0ACC0Q210_RHOML|nr:hypothetical protein RHMOL_Rhmol01G0109900 [Rhododendron molle]
MESMTSLCGGVHTISTNEKEDNVHPLLREVNKIALVPVALRYSINRGANSPHSALIAGHFPDDDIVMFPGVVHVLFCQSRHVHLNVETICNLYLREFKKAATKKMDMQARMDFLAELKVVTHVHQLNLKQTDDICTFSFLESGRSDGRID